MTELSPQAQAVLDAVKEISPAPADEIAATALRVAADQVVPKTPPPKFAPHYEEGVWDGKDDARDQLLAIATELESRQ